MPRTCLRRDALIRLALGTLSLSSLTGCGTILYPERRGQPSGTIDWKVVALDGIFLLLFVIPGVIAFGVDFTTGAIYLPPYCDGTAGNPGSGATPALPPLTKLNVPRSELTPKGIEAAVSTAVGRPIRLVEGEYVTEELESLDELIPAAERIALREQTNRSVLRAQSE